jgi:hypothetical protein
LNLTLQLKLLAKHSQPDGHLMRILLIADGRSPTARRWLAGLQSLGHEVILISTYPCEPVPGVARQEMIPVAFSSLAGSAPGSGVSRPRTASGFRVGSLKPLIGRWRSLFMAGRYWLGPLSILHSTGQYLQLLDDIRPDLVQALRIPFEGMLGCATPRQIPFVVSIWGNDLTLHGRGSPWMRDFTVRCLKRADGLMADTRCDLRLGQLWGFNPANPVLMAPGSGGIDLDEIRQARIHEFHPLSESLPAGVPLVVNPRGFRPGSLRQDVFFQAIPAVLRRHPLTVFLCPAMAGQIEAQRWVNALGIGSQVRLLPALPQPVLWEIFHRAQVFVSPSVHDGTSNAVLESMACGCFPVAGDIESLREWITPGVNGLLVDANAPDALAGAISLALDSGDLRRQAAVANHRIIAQKATRKVVQTQLDGFLKKIIRV